MPHHTLHMSQHVYRDVVLLCLVTLGDLPFEIISDIRSNSITWGGSQCITNKIFPHQALKMLKMAFSRCSKLHLHSPSFQFFDKTEILWWPYKVSWQQPKFEYHSVRDSHIISSQHYEFFMIHWNSLGRLDWNVRKCDTRNVKKTSFLNTYKATKCC